MVVALKLLSTVRASGREDKPDMKPGEQGQAGICKDALELVRTSKIWCGQGPGACRHGAAHTPGPGHGDFRVPGGSRSKAGRSASARGRAYTPQLRHVPHPPAEPNSCGFSLEMHQITLGGKKHLFPERQF